MAALLRAGRFRFLQDGVGRCLHHHPDGVPTDARGAGEQCVLWHLDTRVDVDEPWGMDMHRVAEIHTAATELQRR